MSKYFVLAVLLLTACGPMDNPNGPEDGSENNSEQSSSSPNVSASDAPDAVNQRPSPEDIATFTGLKASACSEEGSLTSKNGQKTSVIFKNSADAAVTVYWLDMAGERVEYKKLAAGESYTQQTFVTHPWLIANEADQCLGIYTPTSTSNVILNIKQSVTLTGDTTAGDFANLSPVTEANVTEERVRQGLACLNAKGLETDAKAVQGILNLYVQFKPTLGEEAAKQGYLSSTVKTLNENGC